MFVRETEHLFNSICFHLFKVFFLTDGNNFGDLESKKSVL